MNFGQAIEAMEAGSKVARVGWNAAAAKKMDVPVSGRDMLEFERDLCDLLNRHSMENNSNTPDHLLAGYLTNCLRNWNTYTALRHNWYVPGEAHGGGTLPTPNMDWKQIDTAQKDGNCILVWNSDGVNEVYWDAESEWWYHEVGFDNPFPLRGDAPSHWMPLPLPPNAK